MVNDILIKKSKIEGKGVFAGRDFRTGEVVVKWDISHQLTSEEATKLSESEKRYVVYVKGKHISLQSPAKYVNHSCDANTRAYNFCDIAKRDIKKGEEITANYSETMDSNEVMNCACGSKNCRRVIRAQH